MPEWRPELRTIVEVQSVFHNGARKLGIDDGNDFYRSRIRERGEHLRGSQPYVAKALGKELGISIPQLDVVACGRARFEPDGVANDEGALKRED